MGPINALLLIYLEYAYPQGFGFFSVTFIAYVSILLLFNASQSICTRTFENLL